MGKLLFWFIAIVFFVGILKSTGSKKLMWFLAGMILMQDRIILLDTPTVISFHRFLIYTLLLSEIKNLRRFFLNLRFFPVAKPLVFVFIAMLCIGAFDGRHSLFLNVYRSTDEFVQSFLIVLMSFSSFSKISEWKKFSRSLIILGFFLSFYAFLNFLLKANPLDSYISKVYNSTSSFDVYLLSEGRFRVNSFVSHPIYFGYLSGILLLMSLYCFFFVRKLKQIALIGMPTFFMCVVLSNSRTPILATAVGLFVFVLAGFKPAARVKTLAVGVLLLLFLNSISLVNDTFDSTTELFSKEQKTTGSSFDMRTAQLFASYKEFMKNPIFGNGLYYINENLGWDRNPENRIRDEDFQGFESYIYHLLIEQGLLGILANLMFFIGVLSYFIKKRRIWREVSALGLAVSVMFLTFIIGTGTVNSWTVTMVLLGILVKLITMEEYDRRLMDETTSGLGKGGSVR